MGPMYWARTVRERTSRPSLEGGRGVRLLWLPLLRGRLAPGTHRVHQQRRTDSNHDGTHHRGPAEDCQRAEQHEQHPGHHHDDGASLAGLRHALGWAFWECGRHHPPLSRIGQAGCQVDGLPTACVRCERPFVGGHRHARLRQVQPQMLTEADPPPVPKSHARSVSPRRRQPQGTGVAAPCMSPPRPPGTHRARVWLVLVEPWPGVVVVLLELPAELVDQVVGPAAW